MMKSFSLAICLLIASYAVCVPVSKEHSIYIQSMIKLFMESKGVHPCGVICPPDCPSSVAESDSPSPQNELMLPAIIIWHPLLTYVNSFADQIFKCDKCDKPMYQSSWNDGTLPCNSPRLIHDVDSTVLLVSAVYFCDNGHKIIAHDERVLCKLHCKGVIPFVLLHKTGFTKRFVRMCESLCQTGMNFHSLETAIGHLRWQYFEERRKVYLHTSKQITNTDEISIRIPSFEESAGKLVPSDDAIRQCFLTSFNENEHLYMSYIQSIDTGNTLCFDHTFKIASNVGYFREDKKWVCQYDSAFLVFNKEGKIVSWQYTKGSGFNHVRPLLQSLLSRAQTQGNVIGTVYVDNCCQWRNKIQEVFGKEYIVLLDVFHAIQRITRKIPKRHPFHASCAHDLGLVFRADGDYGDVRSKPTPPPSSILDNLKSFTQKWKHITFEGRHVLDSDALAEIEKLKTHITKGCLSNIDVGGGTNKNEAFHRYINTFFHKAELAFF